MIFSFILELIQMRYNKKAADYNERRIALARSHAESGEDGQPDIKA
jgi:hypothetical protein